MATKKTLLELENLTALMVTPLINSAVDGYLNFHSTIEGVNYSLHWKIEEEDGLYHLIQADIIS